MRELSLNGYIDDEMWFGDEITPESLHEALYGAENQLADDVHIRLNSYGGSCNAAVRMFDDVRAYPGSVRITVSGTAASAATVLAMAADRLEMTPGSLWMIHDRVAVRIHRRHLRRRQAWRAGERRGAQGESGLCQSEGTGMAGSP